MLDYTKIESRLKSFLKNNKRLSFSVALLVTFLINGDFSYTDEALKVPVVTRQELQDKIIAEQDNVAQLIKDTERNENEIELKIKKLTQRAEFWVKPLDKSYQLFFIADWGKFSRNRSNTASNFNGVEYSTEVGQENGYGQYANGKYLGMYGIVKNPIEFVDKIDFGANITPKSVPEKTIVEKSVSKKVIIPPTVDRPEITVGSVQLAPVSPLQIGTMRAPNQPTVNVSAPGAMPSLGAITVSPVTALNISPNPPTVGETPTVEAPTVQPPATPAGFTPRLVSPPVIEEKKVNDPRVPNPPATNVNYQDVPNNSTGWYGGTGPSLVTGNNGLISQLNLIAGKFEMYFRGHGQGQDHKFTEADDSEGVLPSTYSVNGMPKVAFYGIGGKSLVTIPNTVTIKAVGNNSTNSSLNAIFYLGNQTTVVGSESKLINKATVNLYGNKIVVSNIDNVSSAGDITFLNEGNIIGYAEAGEYDTGKVGSNTIGNFIFGGYSYGDRGVDTIENGASGKVIFYAPNSVGWAYTSSATQAIKRSSINNGVMKLYGHHSLGIATDGDVTVEQMSWADIQLNKPIEILGDQSVGASIKTEPDETKSTNFFNSTWNIKIGGLDKVQAAGSGDEIYDTKTSTSKAGDTKKVEQSIGLNFDFTFNTPGINERKINKYKVSLEADADSSTGIRVGKANINLTDADTFTQVKINGTNNIGLLSDGADAVLKYTNTRNALNLDGGSGNILFATINSGKLNVENEFKLKTSTDSEETTGDKFVSTYAKGSGSVVTLEKGISFKHTGAETIGMYATDSGKITVTNPTPVTLPAVTATTIVDNSTLPSVATTPTISSKLSITGAKSVGFYSSNGGLVENKNSSIKVTDGSALAYAKGTNSKITVSNSLLDYSGEGYSLYTENGGKIDADNSVLVLRGKAVGMRVTSATNGDISFANGKIVMMSNDAIPFVASDITTTVNASNILTGLGLPSTITIAKGKEGTTVYNKYKIAAVDGMTKLNIDQDLDKKYATDDANETSSDLSKKASYDLFRRYLIQRAKVEVNGHKIKAVLDDSDLTTLDTTQTVGLEMNSSKNATSKTGTSIDLKNNAEIIADKKGSGSGAVGAYINYGLVNIDATSKIEVEKDATTGNTANDSAVGVYAVNGSEVSNAGTITVGGNQSIGILGLAYREALNNVTNKIEPVVNEFGTTATNQGKIKIKNTKDIDVSSGENTVGIYAMNNNTSSAVADHTVENTGNIIVGNSTGTNTSIGIYSDKAKVLPKDGTIKIGEKAVGIYAKDSIVGATGDNLGNIDFAGEKGVGIYLKDTSTLLGNKVTLKQTTTGTLKGKVGILADSLTNKTLTTEVVADTGVNDVIAYYSKGNGTLTVQADISLNKNSTGISGENTENLVYSGSKTMKLGEGSTGIFGQKNIDFASGSNIELNGNSTVGVFAKGTSGVINSEGNIKFTKENSIGLYGSTGATINDKTALMYFSSGTAKNNIGVYLAGAKWIDTRTAAYTFNSDHEKNNIYLFAQGANNGTNDLGSTATLNNNFNVAPGGTASSTNKTIGMYFDTAVKGKTTFVDNTLDMTNGKVVVTNKGIGIYAKNGSTDKNNIINKIAISSTGDSTVGLFTDGNLKLDGTGGKVEALNQGIGLYGNSGKITVTNTHKVEVTSAGTGMYLTGESYLDGGKLELENKTTGTTAAAIYYKKGTSSNEVNHKTDLTTTAGNDLLALYADGGIKLNNNNSIVIDTGKNNVGSYVTGGSIFNNKGSINLGTATGTNLINAIGIYVADGEATNTAGKTIEIYDRNNVGGSSLSVGMLAKANAGATATIKNAGNINVTGEAVGMNVDDNSTGINSGNITAKENNNLKAIGAHVNGANAKFTNSGTISADNIALALKSTTATKITNSGTLKLTKTGAVGVYADDSIVDFNIAPTVATGADGTVALYATGNTKIKSQITSVTGKSHIGVYAEGNAEFQSGSKVIVGNGIGNDYGIGIYTKAGYNKAITSNIDLNGAETIGLYLGNDTVSSTGSTVNHTGTINVGSGIGVFIPQHSKFVAQNTTFNVNGGTAVYLKGGEVDLGSTGTATINFTGTGGRGIFQDGGTITTGSGLNIVGSGSFLTLKNANSTINSVLTVGTEGIGINGIFDAIGKDYTLTLDSPNGHIKLNGNKAKGIIAVAEPSVAPNKVDIVNKGTIETISGAETTGIYAKGANVHNQTGAKVNIGAKGVAIYTTNDSALTNTSLTNDGEIKLIGDEATGVMAIKANTTKDFVLGKINGTKDKLVGAYFENSVNPVKVKDFNINLGTNAKGLVFKEGKDFTIDTTTTNNKIAVGNTTGADRGIGIVALGVNGNVTKTDVTVGKNSLGLYVKDKKLTFDLANGKLESSDTNRSSILAYADGNTSEIALNGGGTLKVGKDGIAVGTKGGKITANATTTIEVDGVKGLGAYIENGETISSNFDVKVKSAEGIGMYAKGGTLTSVAKVSEIKGNKSKGYVFENITNALNIANPIQLTDINATEQVGVVVKGTGAGLTATGVSVIGSGNTGIYNETSGAVINNGTLTVGDSTGDSSIGIYSKGGAVTSTGNATIGKNSIAIYAKKTGVNFNGDITLDEKAIGLYIENDSTTEGDTNINGNVTVGSNGAIGVQATNSKINFNGDLSVATGDSKGIFSSETGDVITSGNITVADNSVGIYKSGNAEVKTTVGKTIAVADNGYGIFAKGGAKVTNNANVTVGEDSVGIYVDGNNLTSIADVTVADKGVGLLVKNGGTLTSTGLLTVGSNNAVGLYADNSNIIQNGLLNIGANDGIGIYSKGTGNISTVGNITVGNDAIGVYKTGKGLVNISSTMNIGDKGYGAYYVGTSKTDSTLNVTGNMTLGKEAVGVYTKNTTVNYNGDITVGETTIGSNGYNNPKVNKNSIGIFGDNSEINYTGNMLVEKPLSVGIYGANGGSITLKSGSTLTAKNGATGIMTGNGVSTITIESGATLNAIGKARDVDPNADTKNATFGISAFSGNIYNYGVINATTGATAIYKDGTAELKNRGTINIDPSSSVLGATPTKANADVGGVNVDISGKTTIGGKLINGGTINIKGDLAMEGMGLDISTGKIVVDARTITGVAYVEPTFSKGNSEQKITVKDVFRIAPSGIGAFSGDVKSKSVSWIAKITKDPTDTTTVTKDITMVKLPYTSLIAGEKYKNLATGLEDIRSKVDRKSESAIFKSLDNIDNHKDFAAAVANIRGDIYSNIQERMKTVESAFDRSYDELLSSYNKTKNVDKYSVIYTAGEHEDGTVGVSGYKHKTVGALYVNDREAFTYGGKYGWSAGVVGTDFDFRGDTNKDSKERVISGKLGVHYQTALNRDDDNARLKWLSRGEFTVNRHRTKRYGQIGADTYKHKATFYSTDLSWKNKVYYEYDVNTKWTVTPYAGLDMSYGHIFNIRENGENLGLEVKGKDYFVVTPNVGIETKYVLPVGTVHQLFVKADTKFSYDVVEMYRNPNQAKIREASSGYYDLSEPERRKARMGVGAEIGLEKENTYGVTFRAEYQGYKKSQLNYGVRLNYKF
ncbi:autotransporter-associated N-terminal domain-containing protein [Fusobacterium periodonticum]|uniref:autotransporter adhesin RadD n=1 Tax=Fusobacterium periodonticum TaxID=860 RepID=UPI00352C1E6D